MNSSIDKSETMMRWYPYNGLLNYPEFYVDICNASIKLEFMLSYLLWIFCSNSFLILGPQEEERYLIIFIGHDMQRCPLYLRRSWISSSHIRDLFPLSTTMLSRSWLSSNIWWGTREHTVMTPCLPSVLLLCMINSWMDILVMRIEMPSSEHT